MSRERPLQSVPASSEQPHGDAHVTHRPLESYPDLLNAHDMAAIFRVSLCRFYAIAAEGAFDFALNRPRIGKKSWSRERVRQYFAGELRGLTGVAKRA
jgi:hypothetical protein